MPDRFTPGATVRLKSGGPVMTIDKYDGYQGIRKASCKWFDGKQALQFGTFADHELEAVQPPSASIDIV